MCTSYCWPAVRTGGAYYYGMHAPQRTGGTYRRVYLPDDVHIYHTAGVLRTSRVPTVTDTRHHTPLLERIIIHEAHNNIPPPPAPHHQHVTKTLRNGTTTATTTGPLSACTPQGAYQASIVYTVISYIWCTKPDT